MHISLRANDDFDKQLPLRTYESWEGVWGRMDTHTCTVEFFCCPPETTTTLIISSTEET